MKTDTARDSHQHRVNGPAVTWDDGNFMWMLFGKPHRYYGPAISASLVFDGKWYMHGKAFT
jgi:hypothetical protein